MTISILNKPPRHAGEKPLHQPLSVAARGATGVGVHVRTRIWERMARECEAMVQHALSTGRVVPADVMECLDRAISGPDLFAAAAAPDPLDDTAPAEAATRSASAIETSRFVSLAAAHAGLALAIAPATPEAVLLMADERERHPVRSEFGTLPLVRQMLGLALLSLLVLLGVSIGAEVNSVNVSKSLLELSGYSLFMIEAFLVSAASLGSCFANLQKINAVISNGTYDPRVQSTYWTRWVMGVISGIVLSQIVYDFLLHPGSDTTAQAIPAPIGQPLLALFGGYSVDFINGILKRVINALGNLFGVSTDGGIDDQPRTAMAETIAQRRLARASLVLDRERASAASPETADLAKSVNELTQRIAAKTS